MATTRRAATPAVATSDLSLEDLTPEITALQETPAVQEVPAVVTRQEVAPFTSSEDSFLQKLINSRQLPVHVTTVEQAFTIGKMGKELGFPIMQAFHWIIPIQGKYTLSAKAIGALMWKHKVTMQTIEDAMYVYRDGTTSKYPKTVVTPEDKPIDRRTTIKFTRNGIEETVDFTWIDATNMELTIKANWKKMPREMLYARCLSKGANRIGQDFMCGLYSTDEMFDTFGTNESDVTRDESGFITNVITAHQVVSTSTNAAA